MQNPYCPLYSSHFVQENRYYNINCESYTSVYQVPYFLCTLQITRCEIYVHNFCRFSSEPVGFRCTAAQIMTYQLQGAICQYDHSLSVLVFTAWTSRQGGGVYGGQELFEMKLTMPLFTYYPLLFNTRSNKSFL